MTNPHISHRRLHNQHLALPAFENPGDVVRWFGAIQAQDYPGSLWAIGLRMQNAVEADIERAMADSLIVRTHPMRGTWHFVAPQDIRWLLTLMAPGRIASAAYYYRQLELDDATFARSNAILARTLQGGKQLTRRELADALVQSGISPAGLRLTFLLSRAEIEGVIASGARRGKQFTYALLDEIVPAPRTLTRDESLAELARRYFTRHGPATLQDFAWWSGLTASDARAGLEMVKSQFIQEVIDARTYWLSPSTSTTTLSAPTAYVLPAYDEYTVAYQDRSAILDPAHTQQTGHGLAPTIVIDGRIAGTWKRTITKDSVTITTTLLTPLTESQNQALTAALDRYTQFVKA